MLRKSKHLVVYLSILAALTAATALAQTTAQLVGTVTTDGAPLPGVTVTITSPQMQGTRTATTLDTGGYTFQGIPPGDYTVQFELSGMNTVTRSTKIGLGQTGRADADLKVAAVAEAITVTASAPTVLETTQVTSNLTHAEVEALPVRRNQVETALLAPGVNTNTPSINQFQISGSPGYDNLVLVNGVVVSENIRSQARPLYVEDAVQETTIMTGAISAEYGRFTGGVVNSITKSGGNSFSGSYRDNLTNPAWNAATPAGEARPDKLSQIHEGTLGGFIMRDRLWFFANGRKEKRDLPQSTTAIPAGTSPVSPASTPTSFAILFDTKRYEGKLTGQITPAHSIVASYFKIDAISANNFFTSAPIYDLESLTDRSDPESLLSAHYNGILSTNLLLEGQYSQRKQAFENNGAKFTDLVRGTLLIDRSNNVRFNSATFCGVCGTETRDNEEYLVKASYFLGTKSLGTHNMIGGVDRFQEARFANNFQSGSNFRIFVTRVAFNNGQIYPIITPTTASGGGTYFRWTPIFVDANASDLKTDSAFFNDKWDLNDHFTFSIGARWDKNNAADSNGNVISKDSRITPRLGAFYDPQGNGRHRISATYGQYASHIVENAASQNASAGSPATIDFAYSGPSFNTTTLDTPMASVLEQMFAYFNNTQGGTGNTAVSNLRPTGAISFPGFAAYFPNDLRTPYVNEWTLGYAIQLAPRAYAKVDLINRDWHDFYAANVTTQTRHINTETLPNGTVFNIPIDMLEIVNSDNIHREYQGLQLQTRWAPSRYQFGFNYTYSKLKGNAEVETSASGPGAVTNFGSYYPEYLNYDNHHPDGYLQGDQRHRLRAWAGMDIPFPAVLGTLNATLLHNFDSGFALSYLGTIDVRTYAGAPTPTGYNQGVNGAYYFSPRGAVRLPNVQSTDLALRWARKVSRFELFAQGDVLNVFNRHDVGFNANGNASVLASINTTVRTAISATNRDFVTGATLQRFNPYTETPVEGVHYSVDPNFGKALNNNAYQTPRTVRASVGIRF
ncbi:MAG TPA: carboxypeptidase regulatory-like domain-containing protein [Thermoanaerobaculia bacterium]|nr:carboxypeptidase regulatory-like domain-containing protein [Thermoanaerobaculia bacterium]